LTRGGPNGITLSGDSSTVIEGNYIGTNAAGNQRILTTSISQDTGIEISGETGNRVGGPTAAAKHVIANSATGLDIENSSSNTASHNYIGTNAAGTAALYNQMGLYIAYQAHNNDL
jgi:titin